jgi:uncharacterized membrane protein
MARTLSTTRLVLFCLLGALVTVLGTGWRPAPAAAGDKAFSLVALETDALLAPDGSMAVTERVTYRFEGGPFTVGIRSFDAGQADRVRDFRARTAQGVALTPTRVGDAYEFPFERPSSDEIRTFVIQYTIPGAVTVWSDVAELYWQFVGRDHPGIGEMAVQVRLPGSFPTAGPTTPDGDTSVVRAWAHGPRGGAVEPTGDAVVAVVRDVPAKRFVELRVVVPRRAFTAPARAEDHLSVILAEERAFIARTEADAARAERNERLGNVLAPVVALLGLAGTGAAWRRFGREPRPSLPMGRYWREPLDDPPAVVLANLRRGSVNRGDAAGATLIDLAQRGHLTIEETRVERFGPDRVERRFTRTAKPSTDLERFETSLLDIVFRGQPSVTDDELQRWMRSNRSRATAWGQSWPKLVRTAYLERGYLDQRRRDAVLAVVGLAAVLGVTALVVGLVLRSPWWPAPAAAGVLALGGGLALVQNRTTAGVTERAKAKGLERFLRDFSNLDDAPVGHLILWERFLVYAVTLGVADRLLDALAVKAPAVATDPAFGAWYRGTDSGGPVGRLRSIDAIRTGVGRAIGVGTAPSRSGSGGGFSGGGGGGGGGGGFGAR